MAFAPPRKQPSGRGIPVMRKTSSTTASNARQTSCVGGAPCGSDMGGARPRSLRTPGYTQGQGAPAGYAQGQGAPPGSGLRRPAAHPQVETVSSVSSMTVGPDGRQTSIQKQIRVIGTVREAPEGQGRSLRPPSQATRMPGPVRMPAQPRMAQGPTPRGQQGMRLPSDYRTPARAPRPATADVTSMQRMTQRSSNTMLPDGTNMQERSTTRERTTSRPSSGYGPVRTPASVTSSVTSSAVSTGAIPKVKTVSKASKSSVKGTKKTTVTQEVIKLAPQAPPEGRYAQSLKYAPHTREARLHQFSSPPGIRRRMDEGAPKGLKMMPPEYKGVQDIRKLTALAPYKDTISCAMDLTHGRAPAPPGYYADPHESSFLDKRVASEYGSPYATRISPQAMSSGSPRSPLGDPHPSTTLEQEVEGRLFETAALSPGKIVHASGSRQSPTKAHVIMTDHGPVTATEQVLTERRVEKSPGAERISRHITGIERQGCGALKTELHTQQLGPGGLSKRGDTSRETVSITSSQATGAGGIKESTTTVVYETTKPPDNIGLSAEQVEQLVQQEAIDVDKTKKLKPLDLKVISPKTYAIRKREHELKLNYTSVMELQQSLMLPDPSPDHEQEEVQPEMMASIMHTEESGLPLASVPADMYATLFPAKHEIPMIMVNSAAPAPLQAAIVPTQLPENFHAKAATAEIGMAATATSYTGVKPTGNVYSEDPQTQGAKPLARNVARRVKKMKLTDVPLLTSEQPPPWAIEDLQPIINLVGAPPITTLTVESTDPKQQKTPEQPPPEEETIGIECMVQLGPPTHSSKVQLRGSCRPTWFPGYFVALPELPDLVKVEKIPDNVLSMAWRAVQPIYFPNDSIITV